MFENFDSSAHKVGKLHFFVKFAKSKTYILLSAGAEAKAWEGMVSRRFFSRRLGQQGTLTFIDSFLLHFYPALNLMRQSYLCTSLSMLVTLPLFF